jgi:hypothetical protein
MKGYWIDAAARTITEIEWTGESFRTMFPGGPTIGSFFETGDVLYVDDEGLLHKATMAFRIRRRPDGQPMMSNGFMTGRDHGEIVDGHFVEKTLDPAMSIEDLQAEIEWLTVPEALAWYRERVNEASMRTNGRKVMDWRPYLDALEGRR